MCTNLYVQRIDISTIVFHANPLLPVKLVAQFSNVPTYVVNATPLIWKTILKLRSMFVHHIGPTDEWF
jgi:hypothetical protein